MQETELKTTDGSEKATDASSPEMNKSMSHSRCCLLLVSTCEVSWKVVQKDEVSECKLPSEWIADWTRAGCDDDDDDDGGVFSLIGTKWSSFVEINHIVSNETVYNYSSNRLASLLFLTAMSTTALCLLWESKLLFSFNNAAGVVYMLPEGMSRVKH